MQQCVELADLGIMIAIRDSKNPNGHRLHLSPQSLNKFFESIRRGQFDN